MTGKESKDDAVELLGEITGLEVGYLEFTPLKDRFGKTWYYPTWYRCWNPLGKIIADKARDAGIVIDLGPTTIENWSKRLQSIKRGHIVE